MAHCQRVYLFIVSSFSSLIFFLFATSSPLIQMRWIPSYTEGSSIIPLMLMLWFLGCPMQGQGLNFSDPFGILPHNPGYSMTQGAHDFSQCFWRRAGCARVPTCLEEHNSPLPTSPGAAGGSKSLGRFAGCGGLWVTLEVRNPPRAHLHGAVSPTKAAPLPPTPPWVPLYSPGSCHQQPSPEHLLESCPFIFWSNPTPSEVTEKQTAPGACGWQHKAPASLFCKCEMFLQ